MLIISGDEQPDLLPLSQIEVVTIDISYFQVGSRPQVCMGFFLQKVVFWGIENLWGLLLADCFTWYWYKDRISVPC
jgi:hypothetical protein